MDLLYQTVYKHADSTVFWRRRHRVYVVIEYTCTVTCWQYNCRRLHRVCPLWWEYIFCTVTCWQYLHETSQSCFFLLSRHYICTVTCWQYMYCRRPPRVCTSWWSTATGVTWQTISMVSFIFLFWFVISFHFPFFQILCSFTIIGSETSLSARRRSFGRSICHNFPCKVNIHDLW